MSAKSAKHSVLATVGKATVHVLLNVAIYAVLIYAMIHFSNAAYEFSYQVFGESKVSEEDGADVLVTIRKGETTKQIAELLERKGIVPNEMSFFIRAKLMVNHTDPILPGVYRLNPSMNYGEIIETITNPNENMDENMER